MFPTQSLDYRQLSVQLPKFGYHISRALVGRMVTMCIFGNALSCDGFRSFSFFFSGDVYCILKKRSLNKLK